MTEVLDEALDAVAEVDLAGLTDVEVHERLLGLLRGRVRLEALVYDTTDVWDARAIWSDDGSKSPSARITAETGIAKHEAGLAIARARKLRTLPATAAAVRSGQLQPGCVDVLADAMALVDDPHRDRDEQILVDACADVGVDEARRVIRNWIRSHDREGDEERARKRHAGRHLAASETFDGMIHLQGLLPAVGGHELLNELHRLEHLLYLRDRGEPSDPGDEGEGTGEVRTTWQRRADALVEMARRSATLDDHEYRTGRAPRIGLVAVVGVNTGEHLCETLAGTPLPNGEIVPTLDRADITRIVFDGPDHPLSVSSQRTFTGALRAAIQVRDGRCTHPAVCDDPGEICDVDHIVPDAEGGPTSIDNGRLHCRRHNRNLTLRARAPTTRRIRRPPRGWIPDTGPDTEDDTGPDTEDDTGPDAGSDR